MDELSARRLVTASSYRPEPGWKAFGRGAAGGAALFVGVMIVVFYGWAMVELLRASLFSVADAVAWGMFLSAIAGGVTSISRRDSWN